MDRHKYSAISHQGLRYCNPFSVEKMEEFITLLQLTPEDRVLDIGTGKAELLIRLVERYQVTALGLDFSSPFFQEAHEQAAARLPQGKLELQECDASLFRAAPETFDLAICLGACHIYGGFKGTLERLSQYVRPGGQVFVGDGYWKQEPAPEYLAAIEGSREELMTHAENVAAGVSLGLIPQYALVCSDDEWDRYEWSHLRAMERYARQHPEDPDVPALLARRRAWRDISLRWGRDTMGFGMYLFQK